MALDRGTDHARTAPVTSGAHWFRLRAEEFF
jgi:hypothetical protein